MERKDKSPGSHARNTVGNKTENIISPISQPTKRASSRSSSTTNQAVQSPSSPAQASLNNSTKRSSSRSIVPVTSPSASVITSDTAGIVSNQTKRSSSRSTSVFPSVDSSIVGQLSSNKMAVANISSSKRMLARNISETTATPVPSFEQPQKRNSRVLPSPSAGETVNNSLINHPVGSQKRAITRSMDSDSFTSQLVPHKGKSSPFESKPISLSSSPIRNCSSDNTSVIPSSTSSLSAQSTRATSKSSTNSTDLNTGEEDVCAKSPRAKTIQKPPAGVFEPSSKPDTPVNLIDLPAVFNKIDEKLKQINKNSLAAIIHSSASPSLNSISSSGSASTTTSTTTTPTNTTSASTEALPSTIAPAVTSASALSSSSATSSSTSVASLKKTSQFAATLTASAVSAVTSIAKAEVSCTSVTTANSFVSALVPEKQVCQTDFRSMRPKRVNEDKTEEERKGKKRKVIKEIRVHVTKLSPSDILKKAANSSTHKIRRRKTINRTGFPVKKKKKKKPPVLDEGHMEISSSPPPVLEDQTKIEPSGSSSPLHDMTPALTPIGKVKEENNIKEEKQAIDKEAPVKASESRIKEKVIRTSRRRLLQLRARAEASKRRKRKRNGLLRRDGSSDPLCAVPPLPNKRLRKMKEDEDDERYLRNLINESN